MRLVVADTGPINYLVEAELNVQNTPALVRNWAANRPAWVEVHQPRGDFDIMEPLLAGIHEGEKAAIVLACALDANLLLMDDRKGVHAARNKGLRVTGTLGILELASQGGRGDLSQADFSRAIERLRRTNFRGGSGNHLRQPRLRFSRDEVSASEIQIHFREVSPLLIAWSRSILSVTERDEASTALWLVRGED